MAFLVDFLIFPIGCILAKFDCNQIFYWLVFLKFFCFLYCFHVLFNFLLLFLFLIFIWLNVCLDVKIACKFRTRENPIFSMFYFSLKFFLFKNDFLIEIFLVFFNEDVIDFNLIDFGCIFAIQHSVDMGLMSPFHIFHLINAINYYHLVLTSFNLNEEFSCLEIKITKSLSLFKNSIETTRLKLPHSFQKINLRNNILPALFQEPLGGSFHIDLS